MNLLEYAGRCGFEIMEECVECLRTGNVRSDCTLYNPDGKPWTGCPLLDVLDLKEDIRRSNEEGRQYLEYVRELKKKPRKK